MGRARRAGPQGQMCPSPALQGHSLSRTVAELSAATVQEVGVRSAGRGFSAPHVCQALFKLLYFTCWRETKVCAFWLGLISAVYVFHVQGSFLIGGPCFASLVAAMCSVCQRDRILVLTTASSDLGISAGFCSWGTSGYCGHVVKCVVFCAPDPLGLDGFYCSRGCK